MISHRSAPYILDAVERWARARGLWNGRMQRPVANDRVGWHVERWDPAAGLYLRVLHGTLPADVEAHTVDSHTALVWALAVESGGSFHLGRCPLCEGTLFVDRMCTECEGWGDTRCFDGRKVDCERCDGGGWLMQACKACDGSGRDTREVARLVLDAADAWALARGPKPDGLIPPPAWTAARVGLTVHADQIQAEGDPLGTTLALWLAGSLEGLVDDVERLERALHGSTPVGVQGASAEVAL